ncbi:unnamed protein product [Tilletia caries]|nr:hypothetical protein CF335_g6868 [Tilletia laevis]CAD7061726.1 unnamed protein product [Tilletia caries]
MKILLYASAVWRRGTERKVAGQRRPRSATVSAHTVRVPGAKGLVNLAEAVQNVALRLILPVWRITPIVSLQCEVSLPPVRLVLDYLRALYAIRLHALPRQHPVAVRLPAMVPAQEHRGLLQHLLDPARLPSGQLDFEYLFNDKKGIALFAEYATISRAYSSTAAT